MPFLQKKLHATMHAYTLRILVRFRNSHRVEVNTNSTCPELLRGCDDNAPIART
jgi:hypothetical protein